MAIIGEQTQVPHIQNAIKRLWTLISTIRYLLSDSDCAELCALHQAARDDDADALRGMVRLLNRRYHTTGSSFQLLIVQGQHGAELEVREDRF